MPYKKLVKKMEKYLKIISHESYSGDNGVGLYVNSEKIKEFHVSSWSNGQFLNQSYFAGMTDKGLEYVSESQNRSSAIQEFMRRTEKMSGWKFESDEKLIHDFLTQKQIDLILK